MVTKKRRRRTQPRRAPASSSREARALRSGGWWVAVVLAVLGALLYAGTTGHGYTLDDVLVVRDNVVISEGRAWDALSKPYWPEELKTGASNWRPLATLLWTVERGVAGARGALPLYHGLNAVLHGLVVLACFPLARRILRGVGGAWIVCALFAVHPAHTEAVAPVVGRADLLAGLGVLLTLECWCRYRESGRPPWLVAATLAFALGIGGKESAAPVILLLPLADRWLMGRPWSALRDRGALAYVPILAVAVGYGAARVAVLGANTIGHGQAVALGPIERLGFAGRNTVLSAWLLALPTRFHHIITTVAPDAEFTFPLPGAVAGVVWILLALPLWLGWIALVRRAPRAAFCWVAALAFLAPTSGLLPTGAGLALRFLFLPTAFAACGTVLGGMALVRARPSVRNALLAAAAVWAAVALGLTLWRVPKWQNSYTFYRAVLNEEPACYTANSGIGAHIAEQGGNLDEARRYFQRAMEVAGDSPGGINARINLAMSYERSPGNGDAYGPGADLDRARWLYEEALALAPDSVAVRFRLGVLHMYLLDRALREGDRAGMQTHNAAVLRHFNRILQLEPGHPDAAFLNTTCADVLLAQGDRASARARYRAAARAHVTRSADWTARGRPAEAANDRAAAVDRLERALALAPPEDEAAALRAEIARIRGGG